MHEPERAIIRAISIGGDTDTIAAMVGNQIGALHGTAWIPQRWISGLENGERGRDYLVGLARQLSAIDFSQKPFVEDFTPVVDKADSAAGAAESSAKSS